jgi:hypothetical protein
LVHAVKTKIDGRGMALARESNVLLRYRTDYATGRQDSVGIGKAGGRRAGPPTLGIVYKFSINIRPMPLGASAGNIPGRKPDAPAWA